MLKRFIEDMIYYKTTGREHEARFTESRLKKALHEASRRKDLEIHMDYIYEKVRTWRICDVGALERILSLL